MIPEEDPVGTRLASLAVKIADEANGEDIPLSDRLDAFKVLTTYYVNTTKINARASADEDGGPDFASFQSRISASAGRK